MDILKKALSLYTASGAPRQFDCIDLYVQKADEAVHTERIKTEKTFQPLEPAKLPELLKSLAATEAAQPESITHDAAGTKLFLAALPISYGGKKIGALVLQSRKEIPKETSAVAALVTEIAGLAAGHLAEATSDPEHARYRDALLKMRQFQAKLFPQFENVTGADIASVYLPSQLMSGTFVDSVQLDENTYQITACDIAGNDASSSFAGAVIRTMVNSSQKERMAPSSLIMNVTDRISKMVGGIHSIVHMTVYQLNTRTGRVTASSFGDISTIYYLAAKKQFADLGKTEIGKELAKRIVFKDMSFTLSPGDAILYSSRGVRGARKSGAEEMYGERFVKVFRDRIEQPSREIAHEITDDIYTFIDYEPMNDDILLLCIKKL